MTETGYFGPIMIWATFLTGMHFRQPVRWFS